MRFCGEEERRGAKPVALFGGREAAKPRVEYSRETVQ